MKSFPYMDLNHKFSIVVSAGLGTDYQTALLPNNNQVESDS